MTTQRPEKGQLEELDALPTPSARHARTDSAVAAGAGHEMALDVETRLMELSSCAE
jgi:hypothetical protein